MIRKRIVPVFYSRKNEADFAIAENVFFFLVIAYFLLSPVYIFVFRLYYEMYMDDEEKM